MSLVNTRIQNLRAKGNLDKYELRPSRYGALNLFLQQTDEPDGIITPELRQKAEQSIGSTLQTPVIDFDGSVIISGARSVTIQDSENTSQLHTISFATYAWGFTIVPAAFMNNEISIQQDFERKFKKYLYKFGETLDAAAITALDTIKTQVFADLLQYDESGNVVEVPWRLRNNFLGDTNPIMAANDFYGLLHVLGNGGLESIIRKLAQKDIYNIENKTLEFNDKILHFSNRITNESEEFANGFVVQEGSVGVLTRFERESILGTQMANGTSWGIDTLPLLNFPVGTYFYESVGDYNAIAGAATSDLTRARKEHYGFAVDVAFVTPHNSDRGSIASPVLAFKINQETENDAARVFVINPETDPIPVDQVSG